MARKYLYPDEKSLESIDEILKLSAKVLEQDKVVIKDKKSVPPLVGSALGGGAAVAGVVGATGATGLGGLGALGGASFVKGAVATGTAATGGGLLLPFIAPVALLGGIGYLVFKNKKQKEMHNKRLARYKMAVEKQNMAFKKFVEIDKKREINEQQLLKENKDLIKENKDLREKLNELRAINEALMEVISRLGKDLKMA